MWCHILDFAYLVLYLHLFKALLLFSASRFLPHFLVGFAPFLCMKLLVYVKLFAKLDCCRTLCHFSYRSNG
jgi:hypothetical protein